MKSLVWVGSSKDDYIAFPAEVQDEMGYALYQAQIGKTPRQAKALKGFGGGGVIELRVHDARSNAYRTVCGQFGIGSLRPACLPEEVDQGDQDTQAEHRNDQSPAA